VLTSVARICLTGDADYIICKLRQGNLHLVIYNSHHGYCRSNQSGPRTRAMVSAGARGKRGRVVADGAAP